MILKPISSSFTISDTTSTIDEAKLVRIVATTDALVIVYNNGTFQMLAGSVEIVEKEPTDTISTSSSAEVIKCTAVAYKG